MTRRYLLWPACALLLMWIGQPLAGADTVPASTPTSCAVVVHDLTCEYLTDPRGIDVRMPRLSWKLRARSAGVRGIRQQAYQILVASSRELLTGNQGDRWDSGQVRSDASVRVPYGGSALGSGMECWWKVRVRDQHGLLSEWSDAASWTVGLLEPSDWSASWIGTDQVFTRKKGWPPPDNTMPDPWLRRSFTLKERPSRAPLYVASIGYHEVYVNGTRVGDGVLMPSVATHKVRVRYVTYEIAPFLRAGGNVIGIWLGVSWSIFPHYQTADGPATPLVLAQVDILGSDGRQRIVTDSRWKTHPSPNTLLGVWDFMHYGGELYDARKELPGWATTAVDDASWKAATVYTPQVTLSAEMVEPNRIVKPIRPVRIERVAPGEYRVDMGVNFAGWIEADLQGAPGDRIDFQFSERSDQAMTHRLRSAYIVGSSGKGTFRNRFNYSSGRWIRIKGLGYTPSAEAIRGFLVRTDYARAGRFDSSHKLLNDVYAITLWTFENLSLGAYIVDCPQRERMGYGGDAHATTDCGLSNYGLGAFYTKWSQDWRDIQGADGNLPYTAPTCWGGGGPAWSGFCVTLPWKLYRRYGDERILEINFPTIQRWLAFLESKATDDLLVRWGGKWDFLGDWLWPGAEGVNGDTVETLCFNNCFWIHNLDTAAAIAEVLGKDMEAAMYRARAARIRRAVHGKFYSAEDHSYVNGFQAYLAAALLAGVPPADQRAAVWQRLEREILEVRGGHFHAGITGGYFLIEELLAAHRSDLIFTMTTQEDYPGYADMMGRGATTVWEAWDGHNSLLHSSYLWIGSWFIRGLGGIQEDPEVPGFKSFVIRPAVVGDPGLSWVRTEYESLYGTVRSAWKVQKGRLILEVTVPPNTTCTCYLPVRGDGAVEEQGVPLDQAEAVEVLESAEDQVTLRLQSGNFKLSVPWRG